ncbi:type II secretion system protein N [Oceanicoccus sp. KOV_DT_Chl]|uniref:type II secretion system protein N n=1 Tax=Oceanicoccus sp. KOV_DT_Chl TaxID=1904639 RepID=UPI000C795698|nr:type II secretion system protein N [Oceanicoccus sp. KOV_DT_Chl]
MISRWQQKFDDIDTAQALRYAGMLIALLMALLIGQQLFNTFNTLDHQPVHGVSKVSKQTAAPYNARTITTSHLFGLYSGGSNGAANLPVTRLQLELRGAFTSSNPDQASAIIKGPDGESRAYKVNSRIYGTARLHKVFADRIVLSRNGQLETLYFPDPSSTTSSQTAVTTSYSDSSSGYDIPEDAMKLVQDNMSLQEIQQTTKALKSSAMTAEQRQALIRKRLQDLRDRANAKK